ncbi:hypothetical protein HID58_042437 [Brassica napus]|uniref:Aminotransferase-like plant mobile domain-containing protein n=2 Tax=Brassica napus TaxID=3708 RepID=A0ABQ8BDS1_BRANA|nr:hypothetical protein HID58_046375 [Brassica napus]KAH0902934.1 hypothetical protein HID58_042437 [Brassica napus]
MTSVRGSVDNPVKKEKTEMNTAPPPSQWEKWCKRKGHGLQLSDSPLPEDASPQASLYYISEESWKGFTEWALKPIPLTIGPTCFNLSVATRVVSAGKWLGNEEMDAVMFIWRVNTTLNRWAPRRVAFMSAMFCLQVDAAYKKFLPNKKAYQLPDFLLGYGRGELPSHGQTDLVWGVDVDRLYFPLFVNARIRVMGRDCSGEKLEIDSLMSSVNSSSTTRDRLAKQRGIPTRCNCELVNLIVYWMLLMKDKTHLFKWTDKSVVEEIEDFQDLFDVLLVDNSEFQKSVRAGEAMMTRHESRIQEMEDAMCHYEEKTSECIRELRGIKALFVCCLVMVFLYHIYA